MNKADFQVDTRELQRMFAELEPRRRKQVFRAVLNQSSNILIREARKNLKSVVKDPHSINSWNGKKLQAGIGKRMARDAKSVKIHIMGDFRLKFFEMGTSDRHTRRHSKARGGKGGYKGRIEGHYFFRKAQEATESRIFSEIDERLSNQVRRINEKYT